MLTVQTLPRHEIIDKILSRILVFDFLDLEKVLIWQTIYRVNDSREKIVNIRLSTFFNMLEFNLCLTLFKKLICFSAAVRPRSSWLEVSLTVAEKRRVTLLDRRRVTSDVSTIAF